MAEALQTCVIHSFPKWLAQTQTWLYNQVRYLPETIENHVVCEKTSNLEQFRVPNIHCMSDISRWNLLRKKFPHKLFASTYSEYLISQAQQYDANILHSHFGYIGWANLRAAKKAGLKHVVTFYGLDVTYLPKAFFLWYSRYRELFKHVDRVLCEGPFMAKTVVQKLGCPEEKIIVQHLGVTLDTIPFKLRTWDDNSPLKILIAASFREKKGIPYALEALGRLQKDVPIEITIIGDAGSKSEKDKILAIIKKYKMESKTTMLGYRPFSVLFEEAYKHHIFLSPSVTAKDGDTEGGAPVSVIEMAATGMPVVSSQHCDIPEIIKHGKTGLLSKERDVDEIFENLMWLVNNKTEWVTIAKAARQHIESEFNATVQGKKLASIYEELT
ncbi:MAG: colanic acid biosynthesis glycosyltransferase WcaL [Candidatus Margulisiibacteriota bacterium]|nr:MAG: colanic acid biosynthesis glycosyltransferase WcaL [Candidatus Margulisbacteria bacterium GWD2_39_127]OGI04420.1 MAG: colanic acid biosynthesis glycosyltransferase WcaL [Candidatus Margulisbacteria bacterium GWF2_38_17]OGI07858.1 MAG: colanic acid biosynthesis glycosyltransferase WcaL [Candidatus Margulisbacteria bacterium GWE2_39_32]PZM80086.1 MAG: colanic acid biosynthesis glycosyltransferase WcaL [Candidatus Margulisiibacteriota bacterium]HAR62650.1 colanic acid biosynthesis glycosyl